MLQHLTRCLLAGCILLLLGSVAAGDVLVLTDGTRLEGTITRTDSGYTVTAADGSVVQVRAQEVASVEVTGGRATPAQADQRLASLLRAIEHLDDLEMIISRLERFIEMNQPTPGAREAQERLEQYLEYRERGFVKHAGRWVSPEQRDEMLRESFFEIARIRTQIKEGDVTAARESLRAMLSESPENVSALYLMAVLDLRSGELVRARTMLERVRAHEPGHAPTLVNLATINMQQNRHPRALAFLIEAMEAAPGNRQVLDNVAEALAMLPPGEADSRTAERARQLFLAQDAALRQEMAERGLYRWGSTWVPREQYERLREIEEEIGQALADLERRHRALEQEIVAINDRISRNDRFMQSLQAERTYIDAEGRVFQAPLPPVYYETQREQQELAALRTARQQEMQRLPAEAARQQERYPTPPFKGRLEVIGEDGVPVRLPVAPPAQPAGEEPPADMGDADEDPEQDEGGNEED